MFEKRQRRTGYLFIAPWIVGAVGLLIFPVVFSLALSFSDLLNVTNYQMKWVGLKNYIEAFREDVTFVPLLLSEIGKMLLHLPLIVIFSLIMGILLSKKILFRGFFRSVFFLPVILGSGMVMQQLLGQGVNSTSMDMVRGILLPPSVQLYIGEELTSLATGFLSNITVVMWKSGVQILLILGGIQSISPSLYESARIDSATEWDMFWKITLPMITPVLLVTIVYTIVDSFTDASNPLLDFLNNQMFKLAHFEYASATGWIYFGVVILFVGVSFACLYPVIRNVSED